jgi:hypothetical protein
MRKNDLNPIRSGIRQTPERSDHTLAALRIRRQHQTGSLVSE